MINSENYLLNISTKKIKYGLERTKALLDLCNNPEKKIFSVQLVGTNGKGSTAAMLANIMQKVNTKWGYILPRI